MNAVVHCPRCQTSVTVDDHGRCAYCRRVLAAPGLDAPLEPGRVAPEPEPVAADVCRGCGKAPRRWRLGPYAGLCETCAEPLRAAARERSSAASRKRWRRYAHDEPETQDPNGGGMPEQPEAAVASENGHHPGSLEQAALELVAAARRVDAAQQAWDALADERERISRAELELNAARASYRMNARSLASEPA